MRPFGNSFATNFGEICRKMSAGVFAESDMHAEPIKPSIFAEPSTAPSAQKDHTFDALRRRRCGLSTFILLPLRIPNRY